MEDYDVVYILVTDIGMLPHRGLRQDYGTPQQLAKLRDVMVATDGWDSQFPIIAEKITAAELAKVMQYRQHARDYSVEAKDEDRLQALDMYWDKPPQYINVTGYRRLAVFLDVAMKVTKKGRRLQQRIPILVPKTPDGRFSAKERIDVQISENKAKTSGFKPMNEEERKDYVDEAILELGLILKDVDPDVREQVIELVRRKF